MFTLTDSTRRCGKYVVSSCTSLAASISGASGGGGGTRRTTSGGGFDTAGMALAVPCLATLEVTWLGVWERRRRRFNLGVSERERQVVLEFTSSLISVNRGRATFFRSVQRVPISARPKEMRQSWSNISKVPKWSTTDMTASFLGTSLPPRDSMIVSSRSKSQSPMSKLR